MTNVLMTDELIAFSVNPGDASSKMVLEGLYLSLAEENIVRFTIYDKDKSIILQLGGCLLLLA